MGSAGLWSEFEVVSGGEWSVPHVVTQAPSGDVMHLLPLWGLWGLAGQLFQLPRAVGFRGPVGQLCPCLLGAPRFGAMVAVILEAGSGREALQGDGKPWRGDRSPPWMEAGFFRLGWGGMRGLPRGRTGGEVRKLKGRMCRARPGCLMFKDR